MKQISSLLTAVALLCGGCGQESAEVPLFKATTREKAEQGDAEAQFNLGLMYEEGQGVLRNYKEAVKWIRKAAEQGFAKAQCYLGVMYHNGKGVPKNYMEALEWFSKAAALEHAESQYWLGVMYDYGKGVTQNFIEAYAWYLLAKANGDEEASKRVSSFEEILTVQNRTKQIEKGQARAAELQRLIEQKSAE